MKCQPVSGTSESRSGRREKLEIVYVEDEQLERLHGSLTYYTFEIVDVRYIYKHSNGV